MFSPRFFETKTASSSLIIFERAKLSTRSITHLLLVQLKDILKEKRRGAEGHRGVLVLSRQCSGSPGTCNPEATGLPGLPLSLSPTLTPDLVPSDYRLFTGLKKQLKGRHFSSGAVIAVAETWLDGKYSDFFFERLAKVRATG